MSQDESKEIQKALEQQQDAPTGRFDILAICVAYESGFGDGVDGRTKPNPYTPDGHLFQAWRIGYGEGADRNALDPLDDTLIDKLDKLLARIAVAAKGPPPELTLWSYHDLPEAVTAMHEEIQRLRRDLAMAEDASAKGDDARAILGGMELDAPSPALVHASRLFDALYEIIELRYPIDDDHRRALREADDAIGADMGNLENDDASI